MEDSLADVGMHVMRYGLVMIWIGGMKFTKVEAESNHSLRTARL